MNYLSSCNLILIETLDCSCSIQRWQSLVSPKTEKEKEQQENEEHEDSSDS